MSAPETKHPAPNDSFKCPACRSPYFGAIFEGGEHVGRYCKGWPSEFDRSYDRCPGAHEERFAPEQPPSAEAAP